MGTKKNNFLGDLASSVKKNRAALAKRKKPKKVHKPHPVLKKVLTVLLVIICVGLVCAVLVGGYVYKFAKNYVNGDNQIDLEEYRSNQAQTSIIYGYDSGNKNKLVELLRLHGAENRVWVDYDQIPKNMVNAYKALEDKRFDEHKGVDWKRTASVVFYYHFQQGGSTITQQLIKNLTGENGRTFSRKFYEILNALNLEKHYSKQSIMESYLNTLYLGEGCYGVKTAAEKYFGKDVGNLNVSECAAIAAITQAPYTYDPLVNPKSNRERQLECLQDMYDQGYLNKDQYDKAVKYTMVFTNSKGYKGSTVKKSADDSDTYTENDVKYTDKTNNGTSSYYVEYVIDSVIADLQSKYDLTYNEAWKKVFFGGLRIYTAVDLNVQEAAEDVYVNRTTFPDEANTKSNPAVQSAMTIMDYSGRVVAMVGGAGKKPSFRCLNRATDSPRQPGSSIKPLSVYSQVIENNVANWSTKIQNYGILVGGKRWPVNYGGLTGSPDSYVTLQYALQDSLNTVPAQLVKMIGLNKCFNFLVDDLHFTTLVTDENDPNYDCNYSSICVGGTSKGVTTIEMAAGFSIFGNNGYYFKPYCYYKVTNSDGTEELLKGGSAGDQVISESTSGVMRELLKRVATSGTGYGYAVRNFDTFAKTGTTSDNKDRWFVGGTPYYVAAVWYGYDKPKYINASGNPAGKIFKAVMDKAHKGLDDKSFPTASGVVARRYCTATGKLAGPGCSGTAIGYYKASALPPTCNGHDSVDTTTDTTKKTDTKKPTNKPTPAPSTTKPATTPPATVPATTKKAG